MEARSGARRSSRHREDSLLDRSHKFFLLRWIDGISDLAGYISGILLLASTLIICEAVALRYVIGAPTVWQTELSIYLLMFAAFVGGAYGLKHGDHVNVDLVIDRLPGRARVAANVLAAILGLVFVVVVGWISFGLWWEATESGETSGTAWNPPMTFPYFIVPLGMALMGLQYLSIIYDRLQDLRAGEDGEEERPSSVEEAEEEMEGGLNQ
jgi:TRAP-type C4-dicarboxylate transport system permease small subunit